MEQTKPNNAQQKRGRWKLLLVLAVCAAPMIFSYLTYYVIKPQGGTTNFGTLIDPRAHPIPALQATSLDGAPAALEAYKGKWILLKTGPAACDKTCMEQMFAMRQVRSMTGKEMERVERVWLITDAQPLETLLIRELDGMRMLRAPDAAVAGWLPVDAGMKRDDALFLIDPLGNLMMRFPPVPAGANEAQKVQHYAKVKKDLVKLLKASAIG